MSILAGWFNWALVDPGPPNAVNGGINGGKGMVPHSAEGDWETLQDLHDFHWARGTAPPGKRASWGATNLKDGRFVQHYSVWAQTWTSGAPYPNDNFFAFENEGSAGEPLTEKQTANIIRVGRELMALQLWTPRRPINSADDKASLYEHREMVRFGAASTSCPSDRIPWGIIVPALKKEENEMQSFLCWDTTNKRVMFVGPAGPVWITQQTTANELSLTFGPMKIALSGEALKAIGAK